MAQGFWHVSIEIGSGKDVRRAVANDLSFDQVRAQVIEPWRGARTFTVSGVLVRSPDAVTAIQIVETAEPMQAFADAHNQRMLDSGIADMATDRRYLPIGAGADRTHELLFNQPAGTGEPLRPASPTTSPRKVVPPSTATLSILFMDLAGWSKLTNAQIATYLEKALPKLDEKVRAFHSTHLNTWGDAVVATFFSAVDAANCALDVRDFFRRALASEGVPRGLVPRISLHTGEVIVATNPLLGREDIFGEDVHLAARLEPVTSPGQVFCTEEVANALKAFEGDAPVAHPMGEVDLPKGFGRVKVFAVTGPNEDAPVAPSPTVGSPPHSPLTPTAAGDASPVDARPPVPENMANDKASIFLLRWLTVVADLGRSGGDAEPMFTPAEIARGAGIPEHKVPLIVMVAYANSHLGVEVRTLQDGDYHLKIGPAKVRERR